MSSRFTSKNGGNSDNLLRANDGHLVRSRGELAIDNWLFHNGLIHQYEKILFFEKSSYIYCDWYIPDLDIYIEYWGREDPIYNKRRVKKEKIYRRRRLNLFSIENFDINDLDKKLSRLLLIKESNESSEKGSLNVNLKQITLVELRCMRTEFRFFVEDHYIFGKVVNTPIIGETKNNIPNIRFTLENHGKEAVVQVWGDKTIKNVKIAQKLIANDQIMILNPILPPRNYNSSEIWVNETKSRLFTLNG